MKWAADEIGKFGNEQIDILDTKDIELIGDESQPILISKEDVEIATDEIPGFEVASKGSLTVALDINITYNLKMEGNAREFVNKIQGIRKDKNFEIADRIIVEVLQNEVMQSSLNEYKAYICGEILADSLEFKPNLTEGVDIEVNEAILKVNVLKNR
jgi:isoleucyl-tRNA synthetase